MNVSLLAASLLAAAAPLDGSPQSGPDGASEIVEFIQTDLNADLSLQGAEIQVQLNDRIAILTGHSRSLAQAERATARAIATDQVRAVVNQVTVLPSTAANITASAKSALRTQKIFPAGDVVVRVTENRLALTGKVSNWDERDLAREIVSEIPGVVAIQNQLEVTHEGVRRDSQIQEHLRFLIKDDPLYEGLKLTVSVKDGIVRLGGTVGSRSEFDRLVRRSYVIGVMDVGVSELAIDRQLAMEGLADKDYSREESLAALRAAFEADSRLVATKLHPEMGEDGVMTLKGTVRSLEESDAAEFTARSIPGVLRVSNRLKIQPGAAKLADATDPPRVLPRGPR